MTAASLPMYDLPEVTLATDSWWRGLAGAMTREGIAEVPHSLTRGAEFVDLWRDPGLLISQTCGYPLTHEYKDDLRLIATPAFSAPGCGGPAYRSFIVVREDDPAKEPADLKGRVIAFNGPESQSGYSAPRAVFAPLSQDGKFFSRAAESGGHANSLDMVAKGKADVCAADCVTYALLARYRPDTVRGLRVLAESPSAPGLPYVTRASLDEDILARLRAALGAAAQDPGLAETRAALFIAGFEVLPDSAYARIVEIENTARDLGYPKLA